MNNQIFQKKFEITLNIVNIWIYQKGLIQMISLVWSFMKKSFLMEESFNMKHFPTKHSNLIDLFEIFI